jgi:hypothetical protein
MDELRAKYTQELLEMSKRVRDEPQPHGEDIWQHIFSERAWPRARGLAGDDAAKGSAGSKKKNGV